MYISSMYEKSYTRRQRSKEIEGYNK